METEFAEFFKVKHAISVNSWTSGLIAAVGALGLDPGQQQWLKNADQTLLVWIDGPNLWLLKGLTSAEAPGR